MVYKKLFQEPKKDGLNSIFFLEIRQPFVRVFKKLVIILGNEQTKNEWNMQEFVSFTYILA